MKKSVLTRRQAEIARLILLEKSPKEMAVELGVAIATIRMHLPRLYSRLGVRGQVGVAIWAMKQQQKQNGT